MKIGIVNDMPMAVEALRRVLLISGEHRILWTAADGAAAVRRAQEEPPELILMDLVMPVMDGVEATRRIMQSSPCNILLVTASVSGNRGKVFEAMGAGALDVVATPVLSNAKKNGTCVLLEKIERIAKISSRTACLRPATTVTALKAKRLSSQGAVFSGRLPPLVVIGCSTGGPQALLRVLGAFPPDFCAAVVVIQHMDKQFTRGLAEWLDSQVACRVRLLVEGERPRAGTVLIPATNDHVVMQKDATLVYSVEPRSVCYQPSVDVFFQSLAAQWQKSCVGILLTGMGRDGAEGLLALKQHGHYSIAQDRQSCVVFGMPKAAIEMDGACEVLPLDAIGKRIVEILHDEEREDGRDG